MGRNCFWIQSGEVGTWPAGEEGHDPALWVGACPAVGGQLEKQGVAAGEGSLRGQGSPGL